MGIWVLEDVEVSIWDVLLLNALMQVSSWSSNLHKEIYGRVNLHRIRKCKQNIPGYMITTVILYKLMNELKIIDTENQPINSEW